MKQKGFTLIELIGVIALIAVVILIIVPSVNTTLRKGSQEADSQFKENMILATKNWAQDNANSLPGNGVTKNVSLSTLQSGGYIDKNLKLPSTGEAATGCIKITGVQKNAKMTYTYEYLSSGC